MSAEDPITAPIKQEVNEADTKRFEFAIEQLLNIQSIPDSARSNVMLVFLGLKPACKFSISFEGETSKGYSRENFNKDKLTLESVFNTLGLKYKVSEEETTEYNLQEVTFYLGHDDDKLKNLYEAWKLDVGQERDIKVGRALGFPETAIQSWVDHDIIKFSDLPPAAAQEFKRAEFVPSREYWQEELNEVRRRNKAVKSIAPKLFEKQ